MKQRLSRTGGGHKPVRAVAWITLIAVLTGVNGWLFTSVFTPVFALQDPDYLFIPFACIAACHLVPRELCAAVRRTLVCATRVFKLPSSREAWDVKNPSLFSPLLLLLLPLATIAMLPTPLRAGAPPWLYLFVDLRWWLAAAVAALVVGAIFRRSAGATAVDPFYPARTP